MKVGTYVKSNAIVFCKDEMTFGVGAGQMSRVYSTKVAVLKAVSFYLSRLCLAVIKVAFVSVRSSLPYWVYPDFCFWR